MSRSRQEQLPPRYEDIRYDILSIDFMVGAQTLRMIHSLNNKDKEGSNGFTSRGSIEHIPYTISKGIEEIDSFVKKAKDKYKPNEAISADDLNKLVSATEKLRNYKYPNIEKDTDNNRVKNYNDIINKLNSELRPIIEEIIEIYKKYLPENNRTWYHRDEEDVAIVSEEEEGSGQITSRASVGGRRKYRKKRTKKRRKSRRKSRRKKRRRKKRTKRRR